MAEPIRLAIIATVYRYLSHAQHIGDRFLVGYPIGGRWHRPNTRVVALYVDQKPDGDLSGERAKEFGFTVYASIAEALRCGGPKLAVDGVLIVAEHGDYKQNDKGQILYPRYEFFEQCLRIFEQDGRSVPVYNDKHLSYSFEKAKRMVDAARGRGFPMLAGSSLPVTWRLPDIEMPDGAHVEEAVMVGNGGTDVMGFHALEAMQCMLERRAGGETGVRSVETLEGAAVWIAGADGRWSKALLSSALSRSDNLLGATVKDGRTQDLTAAGVLPGLVENPLACLIEYRDGTRATLLMLNGAVRDFTFAARLRGAPRPLSTQFLLTPEPNVTYSACLVSKIEEMLITLRAPYPVERTLLTSGLVEACLDSRMHGHTKLDTLHLDVHYRPPVESQRAQS
jgi:hypothetical protein